MKEVFQYSIVIKRPLSLVNVTQPEFFFYNYTSKKQVIESVAKLDFQLKVHAIYKMGVDGISKEMTVGFNDGVLDLIEK